MSCGRTQLLGTVTTNASIIEGAYRQIAPHVILYICCRHPLFPHTPPSTANTEDAFVARTQQQTSCICALSSRAQTRACTFSGEFKNTQLVAPFRSTGLANLLRCAVSAVQLKLHASAYVCARGRVAQCAQLGTGLIDLCLLYENTTRKAARVAATGGELPADRAVFVAEGQHGLVDAAAQDQGHVRDCLQAERCGPGRRHV